MITQRIAIRTAVAGLTFSVALALSAQAADFRLFEDRVQAKQVSIGNSSVYLLAETGNIYERRWDRFDRVDNGVGTRQIVTNGSSLFLLKNNGTVFEFNGFRFNRVYSRFDGKMMAVGGGELFLMLENGNVIKRNWDNWRMVDDGTGTQHISGTSEGFLVTKNNGNVWGYSKWRDRMEPVYREFHNRMAVSDGGEVFVLANNGNIVMGDRGNFRLVDPGTGTKQIDVDGSSLYLVKNNGLVWGYSVRYNEFVNLRTGYETRDITADKGDLFVVKDNGNVWKMTDGFSYFSDRENRRMENFDGLFRRDTSGL